MESIRGMQGVAVRTHLYSSSLIRRLTLEHVDLWEHGYRL